MSAPRPKLHKSGSFGNLDIQKILCKECSNESDEKLQKQRTLRCMHNMIVFTRAQQYKNSREGMLLFRGGKDYPEEKSSLLRKPYDERVESFRRMLEMILRLHNFYGGKPASSKEGKSMFSDTKSIVTTLRCLALMQHYADVANVTTPMLDTTKSIQVAASFAFQNDVPEGRKRCVRMLLVAPPRPFRPKNMKDYWLVQRLGGTDVLFVELQTLLPASALRPQNQAGFLLVKESDLDCMHKILQLLYNIQEGEVPSSYSPADVVDRVFSHAKGSGYVEQLIGRSVKGWDALEEFDHKTLFIPSDVQFDGFFHREEYPGFKTQHLYPDCDPMKGSIKDCCTEAFRQKNAGKT